MPFYEYKCSNCGYETEEFQKISDEPLKKCPECKKNTLKRLIGGGAGLIFKGSGFYLTDYVRNNSTDKKETKITKTDNTPEPKTSSSSSEKTSIQKSSKEKLKPSQRDKTK